MALVSRIFHTIAALALLATLLVGAGNAGAQDPALDPQAYTRLVREALAAARRGDRIGLEDAGARLAATAHVQLDDGTLLAVDNRWLREELAKANPDTVLIASRLGALADALAQPPNAAPPDALARLRAILDAPPYRRAGAPAEPTMPDWLSAFFDWLLRMLEALLRPLGMLPAGTGTGIAWLIAGIGLAAVLGVIIYLLAGLRRGIAGDATLAEDDPEANLTARQAIDQAGTLARDGDYRTAVRFLYLGALLRLDERGALRYDRALTNREYVERVRDNPALRAALTPIVETFDRVWYGYAPLDQAAFDAYRASVERLGRDA
jgi:hypothetical protein